MFATEIQSFVQRFDRLESLILEVTDKVLNSHVDAIRGINAILKTFNDQSDAYKQNIKMFDACAKGFRQVRDACECLREELSSVAGTMIDQSFTD